jgi:hypothetical protein
VATGVIFLEQPGGGLVKMTEQPYEAESRLQNLLAQYPDLLAGDQIDDRSPRKWLLIAQEVGIPDADASSDRWSLDHLFLDQDAIPTFVEVKRSTDTRIRREVVGQLLEYAANARYWRIDRMREIFSAACEKRGTDPIEEIQIALGAGIDPEAFWDAAKRNLDEGRIRLIFVADEIPSPLRAVIEFLNRQMNPAQVLGVEVRQFAGGSETQPISTFVPRVWGQTETIKQRKDITPSRSGPVTEQEYYDALPDGIRANIRALSERLSSDGYRVDATADRSGALRLRYVVSDTNVSPFSIDTAGGGWLEFWHLPGQHVDELRHRLRIAVPSKAKQISSNKGAVGIPLALFANPLLSPEIAEILLWMRSILVSAEDAVDDSVADQELSNRLPGE